MKLNAKNVNEVLRDCLFHTGEPTDIHVEAAAVMLRIGFHPERLESHRADVAAMLDQLPVEFGEATGGGWSFLNACNTRGGVQWGGHRDIDALLALGLGLKLVAFLLPREMWSALPGGMPYFMVKAPAAVAPTGAAT